MLNRYTVKLTNWLLKKSDLTIEQRNLVVIHLLDALKVTTLHDIIKGDEDGIQVNGRTLDIEEAMILREAAVLALNNKALNLIREQVIYETFIGAAFKSAKPEDFLFGRAALWWGERVETHLHTLAQKQPEL